MRNGSTLLGTNTLHSGKGGAGGYITGIAFAADGTKIIRTDTYNAYTAAAGTNITWDTCLKPGINCNASDMEIFWRSDGSAPDPWTSPGTFAAAIAPSNSNVQYIVCLGRVWVTQNAGTLWTRCSMAAKAYTEPNNNNRFANALAVDPQNPAICWFAAPDGLWYTINYGSTWTQISTGTVPAPSPTGSDGACARTNIAFDPSSSVTSSKKQGIYAFINGSGLWHSTNAGSTWTKITNRPTNPTSCAHMKVGPNGYVYVCGVDTVNNGAATGQLSRWNGTAWLEPSGYTCKTIAISPYNAGHVYSAGDGGGLDLSTDYGATWQLGGSFLTNARISPTIPWHAFTNETFMSNGDMEFDPVTNRLWVAEGIGVWYMDSPATTLTLGGTATWTSCSVGIENMVSLTGTFSPSGNFGWAIADRACMAWPKAQVGLNFAATHPKTVNAIENAGSCDWAPEDETFCVAATTFCGSAAYTTDTGATWTCVDTLSGQAGANGLGGNIVCLTKDKWILAETNDGNMFRTSDRGLTWTRCVIGTDTEQVWLHSIYTARRILVRDKDVVGRAYAYNVGKNPPGGASDADRGIWRTNDYGATWTKVFAGNIIGYGPDFYAGKLTQYGVNSWLWAGGNNALGLWKSTDGMATWTEVSGTDNVLGSARFGEVYGAGVAKGLTGSSYPAVLVAGFRMVSPTNAADTLDASGYGFWLSLDGMATWTRVAQYVNGLFDLVQDIAGDPSTFSRFAIMCGGSGYYILDYSYTMRLS